MGWDELPWTDGFWGDATQRADLFLDGYSYRFYRGGKTLSVFTGPGGASYAILRTNEALLAQAFLLELIKDKAVTFE